MPNTHGTLHNGWLIKKGKQVQKFWKFNGYGLAQEDLKDIKGVVLYTTYDGILWATVKEIVAHGQPHRFNNDEAQLILATALWHKKGE